MNDKSIFLIGTFQKIDNLDLGWLDLGAERTPGFYHDFEDAESAVINNCCDIWEYLYNYAVIHEVKPGLYPHYEMRKFYKYNIDIGKYEPIEESEEFKHYSICGIG